MNQVLFPTDCSAHSLNAFHYACNYAKVKDVKLILLNIFPVPIYPSPGPADEHTEMGIATADPTARINAFVEEYIKTDGAVDLQDLLYSVRIIESDIAEGIKEVSDQEEVEMIIMGTERLHLLDSGRFSSITSEIIHSAYCPVLAVPGIQRFQMPKNILCTIDYNNDGKHIVHMLMNFASLFEAQVTFLYVAPDGKYSTDPAFKKNYEATQFYLANFENWHLDVINREGSLRESIGHYIVKHGFDLLAIETRAHWNSLVAGSTTEEIAQTTQIPLLAFHAIK